MTRTMTASEAEVRRELAAANEKIATLQETIGVMALTRLQPIDELLEATAPIDGFGYDYQTLLGIQLVRNAAKIIRAKYAVTGKTETDKDDVLHRPMTDEEARNLCRALRLGLEEQWKTETGEG